MKENLQATEEFKRKIQKIQVEKEMEKKKKIEVFFFNVFIILLLF